MTEKLSGDAQEHRIAACLHACEGLGTADLKGNERGWLSKVVHSAARVESELRYALRSCCAGNTEDDEPVRCQSYEASEQNRPCPRGRCVMAQPDDDALSETAQPPAHPLRAKPFPVIWWQSKESKPGPLTIPWWLAEYAYSVYSRENGRSQTLERLAERGGFHAGELDKYIPDWRERAANGGTTQPNLGTAFDQALSEATGSILSKYAADKIRDRATAIALTAPSPSVNDNEGAAPEKRKA